MNPKKTIHVLAITGLAIAAAWSIKQVSTSFILPPLQRILGTIFGVAFWVFFLWRVWKKPRRWGFGVGVFLIVMCAFQTHLWIRAVGTPRIAELGIDLGITSYVLHELPLVAGGICGILLKWFAPSDSASRL